MLNNLKAGRKLHGKKTSKKTDQKNIEKAFRILKKTMQNNSDIENSLWAAACWSVSVDGYINSGFPYEMFCKEWDEVKEFYKSWRQKQDKKE